MKISSSTVRRLRTDRGWPQEQLAIASGLSLRTVQRVEAEGIASVGTAVSLAATYGVQLFELQAEQPVSTAPKPPFGHSALFLGLAVITVAILGESGRLPGLPQSDVFAAINVLAIIIGTLLVLPALVHLFRQRQYMGAALAVLGMPLVTLLAGGVIFGFVSGRAPTWQLAGIGAAGVALVVIAIRQLRRGSAPAGA